MTTTSDSVNVHDSRRKFDKILLKKFLFMTAPLENTTDSVFRTLAHKYGADLTFTEMTRIDSLARNNKSSMNKIIIPDETPTQIQLVGSNETHLNKFLKNFELNHPSNGFAGFNFNLGCPSPQIIKLGYGSAMIKRITKVKKMVSIIKDHGYPCTIKMRLGLNRYEKERKVYLNLIENVDADFFVVHTRHGGEHYEAHADHTVLKECASLGKKIIANGDITTSEHIDYLKSMDVEGVMIGRGSIKDIAIFNRLKGLDTPSIDSLREEYLLLAQKMKSKNVYIDNILKRLGTPVFNNEVNESG
jgi:tRNA-dihydrouridine synthase B